MQHSLLKYLGGKHTMKSKIIPRIKKTSRFCSVFLGSGGVEFSLDPIGVNEVWNDLDAELINFYNILRSPDTFGSFQRLCELTPFSETEFLASKATLETPLSYFGSSVVRAWRFFVRNRMSRGGSGKSFATHSSRLRRDIGENVSAWLSVVEGLPEFHNRIKYVEIRQMDFRDFIKKYDSFDTFFLCDPPYLPSQRVAGSYTEELTEQDHIDLLEILSDIQGYFLLHGLESDLYRGYKEKHNWTKETFPRKKSSSSKKSKPIYNEIIWRNYQ
jgi:DNA adenine methylase